MRRKITSLAALLLTLFMVLGACTSASPTEDTDKVPDEPAVNTSGDVDLTDDAKEDDSKGTDVSADAEEKTLNLAVSSALTTLSPHNANSSVDYEHQTWVTGGLYELLFDTETQRYKAVPDIAAGEPVGYELSELDPSQTGGKSLYKSWLVELRQDCTFDDGTPINADSFIYSWQMLLDPKLANRNYSNMYNILNTGAYYAGECEWEDVGLQKLSEYEIIITLDDGYLAETPMDLMEVIYSFMQGLVHKEMYESCFNADRTENSYGTTIDKFVASGDYRIVSWIDGSYMEYEKRGDTPLADDYNAERVTVKAIADANTRIQMFEAGEIDLVEADAKKFDDYPVLYSAYANFVDGIFINIESATQPILADVNFRYAIYWGLDRVNLVKLVKPSSVPSPYQFDTRAIIKNPDGSGTYINYRDTDAAKAISIDGHQLTETGYDKDLALEYFETAYVANGGQPISLEMQYSEGDDNEKAWAEAVQDHYQNLFGVDRFKLTLRAVPITGLRENMYRTKLSYDIAVSRGVYAIYRNPWENTNWCYTGAMTYSTQYCLLTEEGRVAWDENFYKGWGGEWAFDAAKKFDLAVTLETIQYEDCTFIPAYDRANRWIISDKITPIMDGLVGDPELMFALLQAEFN